LFECTADGTGARSRAWGRISYCCQRAPLRAEYPNLPCVPHETKHHGRMRKCKGMSKAAMKAKRAHAEI
jgi:hypothetical protein